MIRLSEHECKEIDRIVKKKVGNTFVLSQREMEYVVEKYVKIHKGKSIRIDLCKPHPPQTIIEHPIILQQNLNKLNELYSFVVHWLDKNGNAWRKI